MDLRYVVTSQTELSEFILVEYMCYIYNPVLRTLRQL